MQNQLNNKHITMQKSLQYDKHLQQNKSIHKMTSSMNILISQTINIHPKVLHIKSSIFNYNNIQQHILSNL